MMRTKAFAFLGTLAMLATAACSADRTPLAPQSARPSAAVATVGLAPVTLAEPAVQTSLVRDVALSSDVTVSRSVGVDGGELELPAAGLRVVIPPGALRRTTTITATAIAGDMVAYEFGPHGTRFALPLILIQSTVGTNAGQVPAGSVFQGGYFASRDALDKPSRSARVSELLPTWGVAADGAIAFNVWHFSGYIAGWGRSTDKEK
jgi:hypothetical protein